MSDATAQLDPEDEIEGQDTDLYDTLDRMGLLAYGETFARAVVQQILDIHYPATGSYSQYRALELKELAAVQRVRDRLLDRGMYLKSAFGSYRVLLPSENAEQVQMYTRAADRKLWRAERLARNTPGEHLPGASEDAVRMHMKRTSRRLFGGQVATQ